MKKRINTWPDEPFDRFNRRIAEDLKQRTGSYRARWKMVNRDDAERDVNDIWNICLDCGTKMDLHEDGKCPTIIDAKFIEDDKPQLPSGEEDK